MKLEALKPHDGNCSSRLPPFRAVVMDMDGLALDTESTYCTAWQSAAAELGFSLSPEFCASLFGQHADDVATSLARVCGARFDVADFFQVAGRHWHEHLLTNGVAKMPGLDRLIARLRRHGLPYALATNSDGPYARIVLEQAKVQDLFPVVVTRDQVPRGKPAPDLFLEGARRLGVPPGDCLGLEDSPVGLQACIAAGLVPVLIPPRTAVRSATPAGVRVMPSLATLADRIAWDVCGA